MNVISGCRIALLWVGLPLMAALPIMADEKIQYLPLASYELLSLESQAVHSPGLGGLIVGEDFTVVGLYTRHVFSEDPSYEYPRSYHSAELMLDAATGRHQFLTLVKSESDQPVYGGLATFQAAAVYGYEVILRGNLTFAVGGGVAVSDFGIELADGSPWPILPVPFVRMAYESKLLDAGFDFITGPNLNLTLFPEGHLRLAGDLRMDRFRDLRDLIFEAALRYRFFSPDDSVGDFAGLAVGIKNDTLGFNSGAVDESYEIHYYTLFSELDLTLIKITGGYAFEGRERYGDEQIREMGTGFFLSLQCMYQF